MLEIFTKYMGFPPSYQSLNLEDMLPTQCYNLTLVRPWKYLIEFSDYPIDISASHYEILVIIPWTSNLGELKPDSKKPRPLLPMHKKIVINDW